MPDPSFVLPLLWQSALLPLAVALMALLALGRSPRAAAALALVAGLLASFAVVMGGQWSPLPKVATDSLPWIAIVGAALAIAIEALPGVAARGLLRAGLCLVVAAVVVWPALASLGTSKATLTIAVSGLLAALAWTVLARRQTSGPWQALLLAVVAGGGGLALMLDSSQSLGRLSGALGCALVACALLGRRVPFAPAAAGLAVVLLQAMLVNAQVYADFPAGYIALLLAALLAEPLLQAIQRTRGGTPSIAFGAASAVLTVVPVLVTVGLAVKAMQDSGGY
jgi:hypothetical protein